MQLLVSLVVGALCLRLAFSGLGGAGGGDPLAELASLLRGFPPGALFAGGALTVAQFVVRTQRWRLQVRGLVGHAPAWRESLAINAVANAAVFLLPFRLGEFVRPNLCARRGIMSASAGLAATAVERSVDGLVTTGLFGLLLALSPERFPAEVRAGGLTALLFFGGAVAFFAVAFRARGPALGLVDRLVGLVSPALAQRVVGLAGGFLDGLACFRGPGDIAAFVALSVVFWLGNGLGIHAVVVGLAPDAPLFASMLCMCFLVMGVMLPAPPGNVGNFHAFARLGLVVAGVGAVPALAAAVLLHALTTVFTVALAALAAVAGGLRLRAAGLVDADVRPAPASR